MSLTDTQVLETIKDLNALPKYSHQKPLIDELVIEESDGVFWLMDPVKLGEGFGFAYKTLKDAIRSFDISLTGYDHENQRWLVSVNS